MKQKTVIWLSYQRLSVYIFFISVVERLHITISEDMECYEKDLKFVFKINLNKAIVHCPLNTTCNKETIFHNFTFSINFKTFARRNLENSD